MHNPSFSHPNIPFHQRDIIDNCLYSEWHGWRSKRRKEGVKKVQYANFPAEIPLGSSNLIACNKVIFRQERHGNTDTETNVRIGVLANTRICRCAQLTMHFPNELSNKSNEFHLFHQEATLCQSNGNTMPRCTAYPYILHPPAWSPASPPLRPSKVFWNFADDRR